MAIKTLCNRSGISTSSDITLGPERLEFSLMQSGSITLTEALQVGDKVLIDCTIKVNGYDEHRVFKKDVIIDSVEANNGGSWAGYAYAHFSDDLASTVPGAVQSSDACELMLYTSDYRKKIGAIQIRTVDDITIANRESNYTAGISAFVITREVSDDGDDSDDPTPSQEDIMKNLSRNYTDKEALPVKNPIADALDRLTLVFNGGGKSEQYTIPLTISDSMALPDLTTDVWKEYYAFGDGDDNHFYYGEDYAEDGTSHFNGPRFTHAASAIFILAAVDITYYRPMVVYSGTDEIAGDIVKVVNGVNGMYVYRLDINRLQEAASRGIELRCAGAFGEK